MNKPLDAHELEALTAQPAIPTRKRKTLFLALASGIALAGAAFWTYQTTVASKHVSTDNAYVDAESAQVTALTSGPVAQVRVVDTQVVKKGDVLVVLDDTDRRLELQQAASALAQVERKIRSTRPTTRRSAARSPPATPTSSAPRPSCNGRRRNMIAGCRWPAAAPCPARK